MISICETRTSRIYQHIAENNSWAIISPYRTEYTEDENISRFANLKKDVKELKLGYIQFISRWTKRNKDTGEMISSDEQSLFIPNILKDDAMMLGQKSYLF